MPKIIGCSLCSETFANGKEYRIHWDKEHLKYALEYAKNIKNNRTLYGNSRG